jgi:anti-anti-sigma regulatory factor
MRVYPVNSGPSRGVSRAPEPATHSHDTASPSSITVDAYALTFTDSSRPAALLRAGGSAHDVCVAFRISSPSPKRRRLVALTGTKDYLSPHE